MALQLELDEARGSRAVVAVSGELDVATAPELESFVSRLADSGARLVALDLGHLEFMDSRGADVLARMRDRLVADGGDLAVADPPSNVQRVFRLLSLAFSPAPAAVENAAV